MKSDLEDMAILRLPEVKRLTGLGRTSIYQMMADGKFPRAVALSSRAVGWMVFEDIRGWLQGRSLATF
jgi:prophage regulatory protein